MRSCVVCGAPEHLGLCPVRQALARAKQAPQAETAPQETEGQAARVFASGASRNSDEGKIDYEGFLCPFVLEAFGEYMTKNRKMEDGTLRASDNWQRGIPQDELMKSLLRHVFDLWQQHRTGKEGQNTVETACAVMFNTHAYIRGLIR